MKWCLIVLVYTLLAGHLCEFSVFYLSNEFAITIVLFPRNLCICISGYLSKTMWTSSSDKDRVCVWFFILYRY